MHFDIKNILKNNYNHIFKQAYLDGICNGVTRIKKKNEMHD